MALNQNLRRDVAPSTDSMASVLTALTVLRSNVEAAQRAAVRSLPPGFRFDVQRLDDGRARLAIVDMTRDASFTIGEW